MEKNVTCAEGRLKKVETRTGQSTITRCSNQCKTNEIKYNGYCLDACPVNKYLSTDLLNENICIDNCDSPNFILAGNKCVSQCSDTYFKYDNRSCLDSCPMPFIKTETNYNGKYCSLECKHTDYFKYIEGSSCLLSCSSGYYIKKNGKYFCVNGNNCFIKHDEISLANKECFSSCEASGMPYYDANDIHICYSNCGEINSLYFHIEGEYKCMASCPSNYYSIGRICYCYLYAITDTTDTNKKVCYNDEQDCRTNGGFTYRKGNECLKVCKPYFEVVDDVSVAYLKKCYNSVAECKSNYYYYYNIDMLNCWSICPSTMYSIMVDSEGKPKEDLSGSTCVKECGKDYPKHTYGVNVMILILISEKKMNV